MLLFTADDDYKTLFVTQIRPELSWIAKEAYEMDMNLSRLFDRKNRENFGLTVRDPKGCIVTLNDPLEHDVLTAMLSQIGWVTLNQYSVLKMFQGTMKDALYLEFYPGAKYFIMRDHTGDLRSNQLLSTQEVIQCLHQPDITHSFDDLDQMAQVLSLMQRTLQEG